VLVLVVGASGGTATSSGLIVFPAMPPGQNVPQLYAIQPSGAGLTQLTKWGTPSLDPSFSPSGARIAFARSGYGIYTMNSDGTGLRRLTTNDRDAYPTWSPNGKQIAFVRPIGQFWRIFVVATTGGKAKQVHFSPPAGRPTWSAKGLLVPTGGDLLRADPKTGKVLKYYDANIDAIWGLNSVTVSPGVTRLTYVGSRDPVTGDMECGDGPCQRFGLYLESLTAKKKIGKLIVKDAGPAAFSPDGQKLAFVVNGAVTLRSVATGVQSQIETPDITPVTSTPVAWR
jgi:Tol biopolymer transport system component